MPHDCITLRDVPRPARTPAAGFTLVELLVVIAIIGILVAMLFPVLGRMRNAALTTASLSNLRQIHILMQNYLNQNNYVYPNAVDWDNVLPPAFSDQGGCHPTWRRLIWEALNSSPGFWNPTDWKSYHSIFWCPLQTSKYGSVG